MIAYQYECWKCGKWHDATAESYDEIQEFVAASEALVRFG
jgi:hypothetical protein